ncbi:hypothetical protein Tco_0728453 [Tanacetum coccineum]|uniref:Uncharacterized protein n=1 Tax=Tanacetum coccineum TaxID=301880 RepID=A0ABQ4YM13_9ASTR
MVPAGPAFGFLLPYSILLSLIAGIIEWEVCDSNTGSVIATENTGSDVVRMENEEPDDEGTVNGDVGYGEVIVAFDLLRDALSAIFGLSELKSIPSEDPYEKAAQQLLEQAPRSPEYIPDPMELEDHVPVYITEPKHPEDLVPTEDEAPTPPLPPFFLSPRIRPLSPRALEVEMRDIASAFYHSLHPSGTPPLLPVPLPAPSSSRRADIPEADTPPRKRLLLTTPRPGCEVGESSAAAAARQPGPTIETRLRDTERKMMTALELVNRRKDRAAVRAEIEVLRRERLGSFVPSSLITSMQTLPGKTYSSASNSFGIVPLTSPTLSLFPDDPYMKSLQAFYTEKLPIPSPIIIPSKTQEFFLPEGLLLPMQLSPSTPSQPQALEIGKLPEKSATTS